jgi:hypothetical protein
MGYEKLTLPIYDENHKFPASKWGSLLYYREGIA